MTARTAFLMGVCAGPVLLAGCSGQDNLDKAAPPTTSTGKAPPDVPGKALHKMPPLTGPNAGKGPGADNGP